VPVEKVLKSGPSVHRLMALFALKATRKLLSRLLASRPMGQLAVHADEINGRKRTNPHGGEYITLQAMR
jgi:hypothetical protein